jgi:hypothetical protein
MADASAKTRWERHDGNRLGSLNRARVCSKLTIPSLLLPLGYTEQSPLPTPYQALGARGVNNLASKLLLALFPPGQSCFRMQLDEKVAAQMRVTQTEDGSNVLEAAQNQLAQYEQAVSRNIEASNFRPILFEALKHLIVAGNVLLYMPPDGMRMYRYDQYVVCRHPNGKPLEVVIKECVYPDTLPQNVRAACGITPDHKEKVDVYTVIEWSGNVVKEWQEINEKIVPDSHAYTPTKKARWLPLRWQAVPGIDSGRGLCEEYLGDLMSLEGLSESIVVFAASAAKVIHLVKPLSTTSVKDLNSAKSGDFVTGARADIETMQLEKSADFQAAKAVVDELTLRLSHAFMLQSGTVRNAERVTAEEIRQMAQELEDALGGVYTVLSQELQLPFIRRVIAEMTRAGELPPLPEGEVEPVIVTGFEALGRNHGVNKLRAWISDITSVDPSKGAVLKWDVISKRLAVGYGIEEPDALIKTPQEIAQEQQNAMLSEATTKAVPGVATEVTKGAVAGAMGK